MERERSLVLGVFTTVSGPLSWDIEPSHVVPPYLHILPGVTLRHQNMLEDSAHQLDCMLGKSLAKLDSYPASKFTRDFEDYIKQEKLEENIRHLEG